MGQLKKILVVDDDQDILTITKYALGLKQSIVVKGFLSAEEALQEVETFEPDLILLDIMMPKMDGIEALKALRSHEKTKDIPVIFFTAKAMITELESLSKTGVQGIIVKPFDPLTLLDRVQEIWQSSTMR